MRLLLFVTTHMSASHLSYMSKCWPVATNNSKLLREADVLLYITGNSRPTPALLETAFPHANGLRKVRVAQHANPGKQAGAMLAVAEAVRKGWFTGYDWVIRLNPDVIVRDEVPLLKALRAADSAEWHADAILVDCRQECNFSRRPFGRPLTDFFAMRPRAGAAFPTEYERCLKLNATLNASRESLMSGKSASYFYCNAERSARRAFADVLNASRYQLLEESGPAHLGSCKVVGRPVIHHHEYLKHCDGAQARTWGPPPSYLSDSCILYAQSN